MSDAPPKTVHNEAILVVVAVNPSDPFVEGTLKRRIETKVYPKISEIWAAVTN